MATFFTSDTHFGHAGAMALYRRPFASVADMDAAMVERWNAVVRGEDQVWHLGDFAIRQSEARVANLLHQLHGQKHLIAGNNDTAVTISAPGWSSVQTYAEMRIDGRLLVLCHYPFRTWRDMSKGAINLHGHSHGRLKPIARQIDVGVDFWDFRPHTLQQMVAKTGRRKLPAC
jgi:calcineurin-like phosphoesterase family protein